MFFRWSFWGVAGALLGAGSFGCACGDDFGDLSERPDRRDASTPEFTAFPDSGTTLPAPSSSEAGVLPPPSVSPAPSVPTPVPEPAPVTSREPLGNEAWTLVHGVVDAEHVFFCLAAVSPSDGQMHRLTEQLLPPEGLSYGSSVALALEEVRARLGTEDDYLPLVIATDPERAAGRSCADLLESAGYGLPGGVEQVDAASWVVRESESNEASDAGVRDAGSESTAIEDAAVKDASPPGRVVDAGDASSPGVSPDAAGPRDGGASFVPLPEFRAGELARVSAGALADLSYLGVATGCLGAPGLRHDLETLICGERYPASRSTLSLVFVPLSRVVRFDGIGLQFVNASQGFPEATIRSNPGELEGSFFTIAADVGTGAIAPREAQRSLPADTLGEPFGDVTLEVSFAPSNEIFLTVPWSDPLERAGTTSLANGFATTLILLGPAPSIDFGPPWNPAIVTMVPNDPLRSLGRF